jgi:hypothetical protein
MQKLPHGVSFFDAAGLANLVQIAGRGVDLAMSSMPRPLHFSLNCAIIGSVGANRMLVEQAAPSLQGRRKTNSAIQAMPEAY